METQKKLGLIIRELRTKQNISQEKLAELVGVHRTYIGMIERGEKNITINTIEKIAKGLNIKVWKILERIDI